MSLWSRIFSPSKETEGLDLDQGLINRSTELEFEQRIRVADLVVTGREGRQLMIQQALDIRNRREK